MAEAKHDIYAPSDPALAPGEARCPGPSAQDVLAADGDTPAPLASSRYEFLGDADISWDRYTSEEFLQLEIEHVFRKTWQWVCREEHVPNPGDYYVYDLCDDSVFVIRGDDGELRAFVNSCPHRGMGFFDAGDAGSGKQFIRCPFHGMSWHLDGSLRDIPCRWDFPHVNEDNFGLTSVPCDTWGGFIFINLDPEAAPLLDFLEVLPEHFARAELENRYVTLHTQKILPGNWKMCMEGFLEAFHVLATHPEALRSSAWANTQYDLFSDHVTRFLQTLASGNPQYEKSYSEEEVLRFLGYDADNVPEGARARQVHADALREQLSAAMDVDLSGYSNSEMLDSIEYHLFPNACFFPGVVIPLIYRFRPLGVDRCIHDILMLQPVPENSPRPAPAEVERLPIDVKYVDAESASQNRLAHVLDQDTENFHRQWAGIKASKKGAQTLGNYQEARIRHFHAVLDKYIERGQAQ